VLETEWLTLDVGTAADDKALYRLVGTDDRQEICQYLIWDEPDSVKDIAVWMDRNRSEPYDECGFSGRSGSFLRL